MADLDTHVLIIGAGMSGICTAIQLIRKYGTRNFTIIDKEDRLGGTWAVNTYPGCGCDVPSHFYSYSFALNPEWSEKFALRPEILDYFERVADEYDLKPHIRFRTTVETASWDEKLGIWTTDIRHDESSEKTTIRSSILVSAVGGLSIPKKCDILGASTFKGPLFHSAKWDHSFDWRDKNVVVIGNGCSATQFVPIVSGSPDAARMVTQFANQAHWLAERPNPRYSRLFKWIMRWVPLAMRIYRAFLYWEKERDFRSFGIETGARHRAAEEKTTSDYIRRHAPEEYREFLVPKTQVGCKRRVNDTDYLACLHRHNVRLVYSDPIVEIVQEGVRTQSGEVVRADAIVLATGFQTQKVLSPMEIYGQNGESINEHWQHVSDGVPSAYFGTMLANFPNLFIMMGPNTLSGHLSVIYTTECQVNYTMRVIKPLMRSLAKKQKEQEAKRASSADHDRHVMVTVRPEAEERDLAETQLKAKKLVWATGCSSWFLDPATGRNSVMFPDWQYKFWLGSLWVKWSDLIVGKSPALGGPFEG